MSNFSHRDKKSKKNPKDLEDEFFKQTREGLPSRAPKTLEQALEDHLWEKNDEPTEPTEPEWI